MEPDDLDGDLQQRNAVVGQRDGLRADRERIARQIATLEQQRFAWQRIVGAASAALERRQKELQRELEAAERERAAWIERSG